MPKLDSYWISPDNKVLNVSGTHVRSILRTPQKFGETQKSIMKTYEKYNEKLNTEGKAREEIMIRVIKRGFVRIREYRDRWSIQVYKLLPKVNDQIWAWAKQTKVRDKFADVLISQLGNPGSKIIRSSFDKIASGENIKEGKEIQLIFVDSVYDLNDFKIVKKLSPLL